MKIGLFFYIVVLFVSVAALVVALLSYQRELTNVGSLQLSSVNSVYSEFNQTILSTYTGSTVKRALTLDGTWNTMPNNLITIPFGNTTYRVLINGYSSVSSGSMEFYFTGYRSDTDVGFFPINNIRYIKSFPSGWSVQTTVETLNSQQSLAIYVQGPSGTSIVWKAVVEMLVNS